MKDYSKHYFRLLQGMALSVSDYIRNQKPIVIIVFLLVHSISIYAQDNTISGLVKDNEGEPLPGVSVAVKAGESISGVVTDINGKYQLKASPDATIEFSFIGFKSIQQQVGNRKVINVTLEIDNQILEEVVVVGYGTQKKVNLTGSVSVIDSKAFESVPVANAVQALQGQVPGLNIYSNKGGGLNQKQSINVRGIGTIGEGSTGDALILIDGMEADIFSVNPQDIESISVLKDAAASSIYGSRAPFGVVLVTTKKGKAGKAQINYNNSFRLSSPINMPSSLDSYTYALFFNDAGYNSGWGSYNWVSQTRLQRIKDYMDGKISYTTIPLNGSNTWADGYQEGNDNIDYYNLFFKKNVFAHEHNFSVNGGTDKIQYYLSANYLDQDGTLRMGEDYSKRYTMSAKISAQLSRAVSLSSNTRFVRNDFVQPTHMNDSFFSDIGRQCWPVKPLYDPNGNLFDDHVQQMKNGGRKTERNTWLYQQFNLTIEPIKGWRLIGDLSYRYNTQYAHEDLLTISQIGVDGVTKVRSWDENSSVSESSFASDYFNVNLYTDFEKTFAKSHHLKALAGFQAEANNYRNIWAQKIGITYPGKPTINTSTGIDKDGKVIAPNVSGGHNRWSTAGFFGRVNYDFQEKYLVEANLRYDGSSRFRSDDRWGFFPSASLGWNIAREEFFQPATRIMNTLKLRASYGSLGNQNTTALYPTYTVMGTGTSDKWLMNGVKPNIAWAPALVSYDLTWEKIRTWNVGIDIGLFNNRLTGSFDYFIRNTNDMVGPSEKLPATLGIAVPPSNNTDLQTAGWELELMWKDRLQNGLNYSLRFTLADSRTKITRYSNPSGLIDSFYEGKYCGEIWGYETIGIARTDDEMAEHVGSLVNGGQSALGQDWQAGDIMYSDLNEDGKIDAGARTLDNHGDLKRIGNSTPRYNVGIDLSADWKGFDFRMFWQGTLKRDYFQGSYYFWGANGSQGYWFSTALKGHEDYFRNDESSPLGVNLDSYYPRPLLNTNKNQQCQTKYLQNAAYMRLKNLQIGYTLPRKIVQKMGVQNLRFFASGENLLTITDLVKFFDPETIESGSFAHGYAYPLSRTYAFGLNITF
ncbi:SusC/RagA family TonB-linked outer membrane protein [Bacteroides cellulosilyticus]|jgi:TonB-linked SusC/RagA family outer membrane protein|uniref:SusC/RagA family TonB-linked outer membrane protein n=1 Tax=Bacteroides cellulosilyticus TaxID=246787 RepID=UPI000E52600A|nr:TonB-dependent receptor [Bacteroides cellulosilyticus]RGU30832.1 TonB-dependent receptor [Bacteroides cellulosilyticus]